jgi:hypothetical protein
LMVSVALKSSNSKTMPLLKFLLSMMPLKHFWDTMMVHRALPLVLQTFSRHSDQTVDQAQDFTPYVQTQTAFSIYLTNLGLSGSGGWR